MNSIYHFLSRYIDMERLGMFMNDYYIYIMHGIILVFSILVFVFINIYMYGAVKNAYRMARLQLVSAMKLNRGRNVFSYNYQSQRLGKLGVTYYSHGKVTPTVYLTYKITALIAGFVTGMLFNPVIGVVMGITGYIMPDKLIEARNRQDNEKMLGSIMDIYDIVLLQINSGEYITQVLIDAYRVSTHPRLKEALLELTGDIISTNDLVLSMQMLDNKFDNENIHNLVVLVRQLTETGSVSGLLSDIKKRLANLQESYNSSEQTRINRLIAVSVAAIAAAALGVLLYALSMGIADSAKLLL